LIASSPKSSPRATLILFPASTNANTLSLPLIPILPAATASLFSSSTEVRVSIRLISFESSASSCPAIPVVFSISESWSERATFISYIFLIPATSSLNPAYTSTYDAKRLAVWAIWLKTLIFFPPSSLILASSPRRRANCFFLSAYLAVLRSSFCMDASVARMASFMALMGAVDSLFKTDETSLV